MLAGASTTAAVSLSLTVTGRLLEAESYPPPVARCNRNELSSKGSASWLDVTVTVCTVSQLDAVKLRVCSRSALRFVPLRIRSVPLRPPMVTVTAPVGWDARLTV